MVSLQMETGNIPRRSENISVSSGLQYKMDCCGTDHKPIRYDGNSMKSFCKKKKRNNYDEKKARKIESKYFLVSLR